MKGGEVRQSGGAIAYLWNIMDRDSRFLIASKLSRYRDATGAINAFNEAIHNSHGQKPKVVYTDSHRSYCQGVKDFGEIEHIRSCGINKPHANNNRIERLNGTLRERVKVQRGWKSPKSAIAEGQRIYYNFVKPHQALKGETPAKKVGIENVNNFRSLLTETANKTRGIRK